MSKEKLEYDKELQEQDIELEMALDEIEGEKVESNEDGQLVYKSVNHKDRAAKFGVLSDGETSKYVNIALEYFDHRCALSGEKFEYIDAEEIDRKLTSNLSAEHVVPLCQGGHDIVPNLVPSVLQYNISKNGYYLLDWWKHQKDTEGKQIYSPYRLLKLTNFMIKSLQAREYSQGKTTAKKVEKYKEIILTDNEIDKFLKEIEAQDEIENSEKDNRERKIYSSVITATTLDENNKKVLTKIPEIEANIPSRSEQIRNQEQVDARVMMDIFLMDAVREIREQLPNETITTKDGKELSFDINQLEQLAKEVIGIIPKEVEVRNIILEEIKELGITDNAYSVANDLLKNNEMIEKEIQKNTSQEELRKNVKAELIKQFAKVEKITGKEKLCEIISSSPEVLYINENIQMYVNTVLPKYEQELERLGIKEVDEIDEKNINAAMYIMESYDFKRILGRQLQDDERKILIEKLLYNSALKKKRGTSYISTLYDKLKECKLNEQEVYGTILNYAIGNGKGNYNYALDGTIKYTLRTIRKDVNIDITEEKIKIFLEKELMDAYEFHHEINTKEIDKINEKNINAAMKIIESYDFEKILGRKLQNDERKMLIEKLLDNSLLKKDGSCYISTVYSKLRECKLDQQEAYGVILNYAIGNGNYTSALSGKTKYIPETIRKDVKIDITEEKIKIFLEKELMDAHKFNYEINIEGINEIDEKNINAAMKIMENYHFEKIIGRKLQDNERKILIEKLLDYSRLKKEGSSYISTLYSKLRECKLNEQEAYGVILNYAIGNGNYSKALSGKTKYTPETIREDVKIDITEEKLKIFFEKELMDAHKFDYEITTEGIDEKNISAAMKIMESYDFEKILGRKLQNDERKILIEKLLDNSLLKKGRGTYISMLYSKLRECKLDKQEAYGVILNYAIGNGNYSKALSGKTKYTPETIREDVKIDITEEKLKIFFEKELMDAHKFNYEITTEEIDEKNINAAMKIMESYDFKKILGRKLQNDEKKILIEKLLDNSLLKKGRGTYISMLYSKLREGKLGEQEAYGAILNYAIGNGSYSYAIQGKMKYTPETIREDVKIDITEEDIRKCIEKANKKVKRKNMKDIVAEQKNDVDIGNHESELSFEETFRQAEQTKESDNQER